MAIIITGIVRIISDAAREEIVSTLADMPGVKITNSETRDIVIPGEYFE